MKTKSFILLGFVLLSIGGVCAAPITVNTSCGKTVTIESSDYDTAQEVADAAIAIDAALCP